MAVSPLTAGRLDQPDICLVYATPGQMIILINGLIAAKLLAEPAPSESA